jgi:hypothetical protein
VIYPGKGVVAGLDGCLMDVARWLVGRLLVLLLGWGLKGDLVGILVIGSPRRLIGGSRSAGRAKPGWTDLECFLGLLPSFLDNGESGVVFRKVLFGTWNKSSACFPIFVSFTDCDL